MADNKQDRGPADGSRIALSEDYEVAYWTKTLGVSVEQLRESVGRVGPMVSDVKRDLGRQH